MKKKEILNNEFLPNAQKKLFLYEYYFELFIKLYKNNLLPNKILITGQSGIGKSTFIYHFINSILSNRENYSYDFENFSINSFNRSFRLVGQHCHPNFHLIKNSDDKQIINLQQIKNMILFASKTSFEKNIKFILIDNAEYLNLSSANALLSIVEEPPLNTFIIFIHNSSIKLLDTIKSRCIGFKIFFSKHEKQMMLENLLNYFNMKIDVNFLDKIISFHDSPGTVLNLIKLMDGKTIEMNNPNLINVIFNLMEFISKNKNNTNLNLLQNTVELFFFQKLKNSNNKKKIFLIYSKVINRLNLFRKYNIDMNNTFYEIKENIIHVQ